MTKKCPYCMEEIAEESKVCKFCNSSIVKKCPFCAEEISVLAKKCKFCNSDLSSPTGESPRRAAGAFSNRPIGEEKNIVLYVVLYFITCGIWAWVHIFQIAGDVNNHSGQQKLNPGLDLLLTFVTCGIWAIVVQYKYAKAIYEMQIEEGIQASDNSTLCLILAFFAGFVGLLIMQGELNKHWEMHRQGPSRA